MRTTFFGGGQGFAGAAAALLESVEVAPASFEPVFVEPVFVESAVLPAVGFKEVGAAAQFAVVAFLRGR